MNNKTARFPKRNLVPHSDKGFVDVRHDLGRRLDPAKLKELLPDVAGVTMDNRFWDLLQELMYHDRFIILCNGIKCLLNDMTAKRIHRKLDRVASNCFRNPSHLVRCPVLKASLNEEISKAIYNQGVCLRGYSINDGVLLLRGANL